MLPVALGGAAAVAGDGDRVCQSTFFGGVTRGGLFVMPEIAVFQCHSSIIVVVMVMVVGTPQPLSVSICVPVALPVSCSVCLSGYLSFLSLLFLPSKYIKPTLTPHHFTKMTQPRPIFLFSHSSSFSPFFPSPLLTYNLYCCCCCYCSPPARDSFDNSTLFLQ